MITTRSGVDLLLSSSHPYPTGDGSTNAKMTQNSMTFSWKVQKPPRNAHQLTADESVRTAREDWARPRRRGRKNKACFQCQSRKQKCNQECPCSRCIERGLPHLCRMLGNGPDAESEPQMAREESLPQQGVEPTSRHFSQNPLTH